ncbi:MAG: glycoside hydrolase, partial [Bacteroidota bacterium]
MAEHLFEKGKSIIEKNWRDSFSVPSEKLYPFQWHWDSGFVAMGTACYDVNKAIQEIESLLNGQWENGMIPHILFHSEKESTYFPNFDFWKSEVNPGAPETPKSSGITQPPVLGFVLEEILNRHSEDEKVITFVR